MKTKQSRINAIIDETAKKLEAEGVKYFIGVADRDPKRPTEGRVYIQADAKGEDLCYILDFALPTNQDVINMGIWIGQIITERAKKKKT